MTTAATRITLRNPGDRTGSAPNREPSRDVREPAGVRHAYILAFALSASACDTEPADDPESWSFPDWGTKEDQLGTALTVTRDPAAQVFDGYNHVVDASIRRNCVLPEDGGLEFADFRAGGDLIATELKYLTT